MRLKILSLILISLNLFGCVFDTAPVEPKIKIFTPIYKYTPEGCDPKKDPECKIDWARSYMYGILRSDPNNPEHFERISIFEFLTGEGSGYKPRLLRGLDYVAVSDWEKQMNSWAKAHCEGSK